MAAVAQHGDGIGDLFDLVETVRDIEDRRACRLSFTNREERLRLMRREYRGRFIEDHHAVRFEQGPGVLDQRAIGDRQVAHARPAMRGSPVRRAWPP